VDVNKVNSELRKKAEGVSSWYARWVLWPEAEIYHKEHSLNNSYRAATFHVYCVWLKDS
jgi:hypothetical protein